MIRPPDGGSMSRGWGLLCSRAWWGRTVFVVGHVGAQKPVEMSLVQDEEMVEALAADGADHALHEGIRQGALGAMITCRIPIVSTYRVKISP